MKSVVVKGELREALGKKGAKKLRSEEKAPAVLYGGEKPIHFAVSFAEMRQLVYTPSVYIIDLDLDGTVYKAVMQDIQWHPVEEQILHVDFLSISEDKAVKVEIPVKVEGYAKGLRKGGKLNSTLRRIKVKALPKDLPDTVDIDVTDLDLGESIKVGDLKLDGVDLLNPKSNVVVSVGITRAAKSAQETDDASGDAEGETETEAAAE